VSAVKGGIWAEFAQISFLPRYFRDSQLRYCSCLAIFRSTNAKLRLVLA
jgi:hypothetical protein